MQQSMKLQPFIKAEQLKNIFCFVSEVAFIMLINGKMPTIVGKMQTIVGI